MRNVILICISLVIVGCFAITAQSASMGLAAAWLFDEGTGSDVKDSVGNNDGKIEGNLKWVEGKFGEALQFGGAFDSYVTIPYHNVLDSDTYTITFWVKLESASWQYIAWADGIEWPVAEVKRHLDIWVHQDDYVVIMWNVEGVADCSRIDGKTIVADGAWHHVVQSSDGDTMRLFIDGNLDGEAPIGGKLVVNGEDPLWIGARPGNVAATGIIDEVGFFTEALSADQLNDIKDQGLAVFTSVRPLQKLTATWGAIRAK